MDANWDQVVYLEPAILCLVGLCKPMLNELAVWRMCINVHMVTYTILASYMLWTLLTYQHSKATTDESTIIVGLLLNILNILEMEEGRELLGVCFILAWLVYAKSSSTKIGKMKLESFTSAIFIATIPLSLWGLCYINGIHKYFGYCRQMMKNCATANEGLQT